MDNDYIYYCVVDFEATCWENLTPKEQIIKPWEIIEFPSVLYKLNENTHELEYVSEIQRYCRPVVNQQLSQFCIDLTGIEQKTVDSAEIFPHVLREHYLWVISQVGENNLDKTILLSCGRWDFETALYKELKRWIGNLTFMKNEPILYNFMVAIPSIYKRFINVKDLYEDIYYDKNSMVGMLEKLNIVLEGRHHSGLDDSKNIGKILQKVYSRNTYKKYINLLQWNLKENIPNNEKNPTKNPSQNKPKHFDKHSKKTHT
jgi:inhibitor of KinA sporulation pathway (predicted exonuclease)